MANVLTHYFRLRRGGMRPNRAWDYALALDDIDRRLA